MSGILILIFFIAAFFVLKTYLKVRKAKQLRLEYPRRKTIEVSLAGGTNDARYTAKGFWRAIAATTTQDKKARSKGMGQVDFKYFITVDTPRGTPRLRVLISCDEDNLETVTRAIKNTYEDIMIVELDEDPMREIGELYNQEIDSEMEPEHMGQQPGG